MKKGKLIVYAGPSGVGKGTVKDMFFNKPELNLHWSVSATSRSPREGEVHGHHYHFLTNEEFTNWVEQGKFIEWAEFVGNKYGTLKENVDKQLEEGKNVFLEIEILGVKQIIEKMPEAVTIFLAPPSMEELENRLRSRGTESEETISNRVQRAKEEMAEKDLFKYVVVNDEVEKAATEIEEIIKKEIENV